MTSAKKVVTFLAPDFSLETPEPDETFGELPLGGDCAAFLLDSLRNAGVTLHDDAPVPGEGGWSMDASVDGARVALFVHWAPLGPTNKDTWVVQLRDKRGAISAFFRRASASKDSEAVERISSELKQVLEAWQGAREVRLISDEEFRAVY